MPFSTGCDACGKDNVRVQLCADCIEKIVTIIQQGKKRPDGKYDFDLFANFNKLSRGGH